MCIRDSAYCDGIGDTPQPTVAGNTGSGTFSSTTGLTINSSTGIIDVDASTKGATYVVTYTDTDSDTATANVTLNALDNAAFAYSASSYEPTDADPTPTITGLTGGTFSSTSGLVFVDSGTNTGSSTGEIDLSATTEASYTITYDTTSSGSSVCPNTSTQTVEVAVAGIANNYSMSFDGSDDYIDAGNSSSLVITGNFTISAWINLDTQTGYRRIIGKANSTNTRCNYGLGLENGYKPGVIANSGSWYSNYSTTALNTGTWYHLAGVYDGSNFILYVNGVLDNTTSVSGFNISTAASDTSGDDLLIGAKPIYSSENFAGMMDEIAIWNTALTSTQVSEIYNATGTNLTKDLSTIEPSNLKYWNRMGD